VGQPPRVGFVVSKAVGNAVVRNRTKRRLRAIMAGELSGIPAGVDVVVRAQPAAASVSFRELSEALKPLLDKVTRRFKGSP
jgi:ribonuclease P protein component